MTREIDISSFAGGYDAVTDAGRLPTDRSPDTQNISLRPKNYGAGPAWVRDGCSNAVTLPGVSGKKADIFYSEALNLWLCARETSGAPNTYRLHSRPADFSGSWTDRGKIASAVTARAVFADWPGTTPYALIGTDTSDATDGGIYTFDGTTLTKRQQGNIFALTIWQNRGWLVTNVGTTGTPKCRLVRSPVGDPAAAWPDYIDMREKDAGDITAIGVAGGAMLAFKKRSTYRINDSSTGAYSMIDPSAGAISARGVAYVAGQIYSWGHDGLYGWDGVGRGVRVSHERVPASIFSAAARADLGAVDERIVLGDTSGTTSLFFEYDPALRAFGRHTFASGEFIYSLAQKGTDLYAAMDSNAIYKVLASGVTQDNGTNITAYWKTGRLSIGQLARLQRLRMYGHSDTSATNAKTLEVYRDEGSAEPYVITSKIEQAGSEPFDLQALGHGNVFELRFVVDSGGESSTKTRMERMILTLQPLAA